MGGLGDWFSGLFGNGPDTRSEADKAFGDWFKGNSDRFRTRTGGPGMPYDIAGARTEFDSWYASQQAEAAKKLKDDSANADYLTYAQNAMKTPGRGSTILTDNINFTPNSTFNPKSVL